MRRNRDHSVDFEPQSRRDYPIKPGVYGRMLDQFFEEQRFVHDPCTNCVWICLSL